MNQMTRFLSAALLPVAAAACSPAASTSPVRPPLEGARIGGPFALTDQNGHAVTDRSFAGQWRVMYFGYTSCPDVCPTDAQNIGQGLRLLEQSDPAKAAKVVPVFVTVDPARDTPGVLRQFVSAFHPRMMGLTGSPQAIAALARGYGVYYHAEAPGVVATTPAAADGPGLGGGYRPGQAAADGPGLGGGYRVGRGSDGPGAGGGYRSVQRAADGPGLGGGYRSGPRADGPGAGGGYLVSHSRVAYLMDPQGRPVALVPEDQTPQAVAATLEQWVR